MSTPGTPGALSVTLSLGSKACRDCEYQLNCFCPQISFTPLAIDEDHWQRGCRQFLEPIGKCSVKSHQPMARSGVWRGVLLFFCPRGDTFVPVLQSFGLMRLFSPSSCGTAMVLEQAFLSFPFPPSLLSGQASLNCLLFIEEAEGLVCFSVVLTARDSHFLSLKL